MKIGAVSEAPVMAPAAAKTAAGGKQGFSAALSAAVGKGGAGDLDAIFARASETYGVPENLLRAVARAESGYRADAVSR